jgi:UDP-N-acetylglucosamine 2-epimerase
MVKEMRIALIIGTRPEVIKVAILANKLRELLGTDFQFWDTGQHYDYALDEIFYNEMDIVRPDVNFGIKSGSTSEQLGKIMFHVEDNINKFMPNIVIVVGDTNSTFGAAYMAKRMSIKLAHIEAGPREYFVNYVNSKPMFFKTPDMMNMAENLNRILIDNMSDYLFAPTPMSYDNLFREHLYGEKILSGDIQFDVLLKYLPQIKEYPQPIYNNYNLLTLHRAENTDFKINLVRIMNAFIESDEEILFPMHPRTKKKLQEIGKYDEVNQAPNIHICEPMGFFDFTRALMCCKKVFTDSGGVQKEAYLLNKPCVTLRNSTGWTDIVCSGDNKIVGSNKKIIIEELKNTKKFISKDKGIYGDGKATDKIINYLVK